MKKIHCLQAFQVFKKLVKNKMQVVENIDFPVIRAVNANPLTVRNLKCFVCGNVQSLNLTGPNPNCSK